MYARALARPSIIRCAPTPICQAQAPGCAPVLLLEVTTPLFGEPAVVIAPNYSLYLFRTMPSNWKRGHEEEDCTDCSIVVTQGKQTGKSKILHLVALPLSLTIFPLGQKAHNSLLLPWTGDRTES